MGVISWACAVEIRRALEAVRQCVFPAEYVTGAPRVKQLRRCSPV
jgi:hypothetical protein